LIDLRFNSICTLRDRHSLSGDGFALLIFSPLHRLLKRKAALSGGKVSEELKTAVRQIVKQFDAEDGPLLPILHALGHEFGYVPEEALPMVADALNLSRAEVYGVATFYHDFHMHPKGKHVVKLCRAEACQSMGAVTLAESAKAKLGLEWGDTTPDGKVTLEPTFCLGLCACAPSAMVDGELVGRLTQKRLDDILAKVSA
jgi:formate dehydrogenase subunit gamma